MQKNTRMPAEEEARQGGYFEVDTGRTIKTMTSSRLVQERDQISELLWRWAMAPKHFSVVEELYLQCYKFHALPAPAENIFVLHFLVVLPVSTSGYPSWLTSTYCLHLIGGALVSVSVTWCSWSILVICPLPWSSHFIVSMILSFLLIKCFDLHHLMFCFYF